MAAGALARCAGNRGCRVGGGAGTALAIGSSVASLTVSLECGVMVVALAGDLVADPLVADRAALLALLQEAAEGAEVAQVLVDVTSVSALGCAGASVVLMAYERAPWLCPVVVRAGQWARTIELVTRAAAGRHQYGCAAVPCV